MSNRRYNAQTRTKLYGGGSPSAIKKLQQMLAAQSGKNKKKKTAKPSMLMAAMKGKK